MSNVSFVGLGHINIIVEDIQEGINFYTKLFGAKPYQIFENFCNVGFSKAAGFLDKPENIKLHIAFLEIPGTGLTLELMQYLEPITCNKIVSNRVCDMAGVRHVALKVEKIEKAFDYVTSIEGIKLINEEPAYRPYKIDEISQQDFKFFDNMLESDICEKNKVVRSISNTKYFYFVDKYGVQWEFEEGHTDIGNDK